jgi:hypothetical protein
MPHRLDEAFLPPDLQREPMPETHPTSPNHRQRAAIQGAEATTREITRRLRHA